MFRRTVAILGLFLVPGIRANLYAYTHRSHSVTFQSSGMTYWYIPLRGRAGWRSHAAAMNDRGDVAGWCEIERSHKMHRTACLWTHGVRIDIRPPAGFEKSEAWGINNRGDVVGFCSTSFVRVRAFIWKRGTMTLLQTPEYAVTRAYAINDQGDVAGDFMNSAAIGAFPCRWQKGALQQFGLTDGYFMGGANTINARGQCAGSEGDSDIGPETACAWMEARPALVGPPDAYSSTATAINKDGHIVGNSVGKDHRRRAFEWRHGRSTFLHARGEDCTATGMNDLGDIVGSAGHRAVLFRDGEAVDLNGVAVLPRGVRLSEAVAVSGSGGIACNGSKGACVLMRIGPQAMPCQGSRVNGLGKRAVWDKLSNRTIQTH